MLLMLNLFLLAYRKLIIKKINYHILNGDLVLKDLFIPVVDGSITRNE